MKCVLAILAIVFALALANNETAKPQRAVKCFKSTSCGGNYCKPFPDRRMCFVRNPSCYDHAFCVVQQNGECGWTETATSTACRTKAGKKNETAPETPKSTKCYTAACGGSYCSPIPDRRMCIWHQPTCWDTIKCEVKSNGHCGWTETDDFKKCQAKFGNGTMTRTA